MAAGPAHLLSVRSEPVTSRVRRTGCTLLPILLRTGRQIRLPGCRAGEAGSNRFFKEKLAKSFITTALLQHLIMKLYAPERLMMLLMMMPVIMMWRHLAHTWAADLANASVSCIRPNPSATSCDRTRVVRMLNGAISVLCELVILFLLCH